MLSIGAVTSEMDAAILREAKWKVEIVQLTLHECAPLAAAL